jgi:hypothetical protein
MPQAPHVNISQGGMDGRGFGSAAFFNRGLSGKQSRFATPFFYFVHDCNRSI